jgi:hypothetical protein
MWVWMMAFEIAVVAVYGYIIVLSLWAMRVQRRATTIPHRHNPAAMSHSDERFAHGMIASLLIVSLVIRLVQLTLNLTPWVLVPLTIVMALVTARLLVNVGVMATQDLGNRYVKPLNKVKTAVLLVCATAVIADQVWRVVTLFWP